MRALPMEQVLMSLGRGPGTPATAAESFSGSTASRAELGSQRAVAALEYQSEKGLRKTKLSI